MSSFFVFPRPAASPSTGQASPAGRRATAACRYAATTKAAPAAISPPPRRRRLGRCPAPAPSAPAPRRCATAIRPAAATSTISPPPAAIRRTPWCGAHPPPLRLFRRPRRLPTAWGSGAGGKQQRPAGHRRRSYRADPERPRKAPGERPQPVCRQARHRPRRARTPPGRRQRQWGPLHRRPSEPRRRTRHDERQRASQRQRPHPGPGRRIARPAKPRFS